MNMFLYPPDIILFTDLWFSVNMNITQTQQIICKTLIEAQQMC